MLVRQQVTCHLSYTYFIYLYTVKSSVYITIKSFITITLFYKIAVWGLDRELRYSWSISLLKYPKGSDFRKLMGKLFHSSAPFLLGHRRALRALEDKCHWFEYCTWQLIYLAYSWPVSGAKIWNIVIQRWPRTRFGVRLAGSFLTSISGLVSPCSQLANCKNTVFMELRQSVFFTVHVLFCFHKSPSIFACVPLLRYRSIY